MYCCRAVVSEDDKTTLASYSVSRYVRTWIKFTPEYPFKENNQHYSTMNKIISSSPKQVTFNFITRFNVSLSLKLTKRDHDTFPLTDYFTVFSLQIFTPHLRPFLFIPEHRLKMRQNITYNMDTTLMLTPCYDTVKRLMI